MTPTSKERLDLLGEIGEELRTKTNADLARSRRKQRRIGGGALVALVAIAIALAGLPQVQQSEPELAAADVLHKAAAKVSAIGPIGDNQYIHQHTVSYAYHYKDDAALGRGEKVDYDYYIRLEGDDYIKRDGSGLQIARDGRSAVFLSDAERQQWIADGSPPLPGVSGGGWYARYPPGNTYDFNRRVAQAGNRLTDYFGDQELVRNTLKAYRLTEGKMARAAGNQAQFNRLVLGRVRSTGSKLDKKTSAFSKADTNRVATSLIIGLITNWNTAMPPDVRAALLTLLAQTGSGELKFDPDFRDEAGNRLIALGHNNIGNDPHKVYDLLLFDPETFEQRGTREVFGDGRVWATDLSDYSVTDTEGTIPAGYPDLS